MVEDEETYSIWLGAKTEEPLQLLEPYLEEN
jgi:hypothetical protein